ncbi:long-chain fatty acid--CoA ligase [Clostridium botulinum C/D]|uniref:AMP-binding protein n=1 Tax=Clostridium botulinum TaxID=1491 RepID=UPI001E654651|nr:AMP-binding protein [Clostridium botulinum]MCD3211688.1 long-chain fatty acid--CoA ligase [Clostridium botulinum C/D]
MLIFSGIYKNINDNKNKVCMITEDEKITYQDLINQINKKTLCLNSRFKQGEKVIIKNINPINTIINTLSCSKAGLISIPVDTKILSNSLENIKEVTKPCSIIQDEFIYDYKKNQKIFFDGINLQGINYKNIHSEWVNDNTIFLGALSSGTTGKSKIIWRDHVSWSSAFKYQSQVFHISSKDILFLVGSLSYTANLNSAIHILNEGGTIVFSKSIYPKTWIKEIEDNKVSSIFMVPAHYRLLLKELKKTMLNINSLLSAGAKMDRKTVNSLKERFPSAYICEYYGASELGHISYINFRENFKENSVGRPFPGVNIWLEKIKNEHGVIWVKSDYIAPNFRPKATVGDIGEIDNEGNLYILGRNQEIINKGGVKILPHDVETVLNKHPKISESIVFLMKNYSKGEIVTAIIVARDMSLTTKEVMSYCKKHLDIHKRPQKIRIVSDIKLNLNGKINKKELLKFFNKY